MRARKCNIRRYLVSVNKIRRYLVWVNSIDVLSTGTNGQCIQQIGKSQIIRLSSYSGISYKIIITWITSQGCKDSSANLLFSTKLNDSFHKNQEKAVCTVADWISHFINKLIHVLFILFWMNIINKNTLCHATVKLEKSSVLLEFLSGRNSSQ